MNTFNEDWKYEEKSIDQFIGIEFVSQFYSRSTKNEVILFSLHNSKKDKFTPKNLKEKIEKNMMSIVEDTFQDGKNFFRLIYQNEEKTEEISTSHICELFGKDYHSSLFMKLFF